MHKRVMLTLLSLLFLSAFIFFTSAQLTPNPNPVPELVNQGANFKTLCIDTSCETTIYSYDKYFNRDNQWEEIDEDWHTCGDNFCTNSYHFNATADSSSLVTLGLGNEDFTQQITSFGNESLTFSITPSIDGNTLIYENILSDVDLKYYYLPHKIKEEIVINEPLENLEDDLEIIFNISEIDGFNLEEPFVCDSNRNCKPISYDLDNDQITLTVQRNFLVNESTVYPVIIDPSFTLDNSSIIWNGRVEETISDEGSELIYLRINNPSSLELGLISGGVGTGRGDIDWNFAKVPNLGTINNATLRLYIETFTAPNFLNITNIEKNSSQRTDNSAGNEQFFYDMRNGTIYSNIYSPIPGGNFLLDLSFNQQGRNDIHTALATAKRFSTGLDSDYTKNITISARDHSNPAVRPLLILQHTKEDYTLTYDANGNLIQGFGKYMEYDGWNRLSKIKNTDVNGRLLAEYFYDHQGLRMKKTVYNVSGNGHNESTYYMNTRPADFIQVINTNGTIINETYVYLQDKLIAKFDTTGRKFFYHPDHLGSTNLVTNESGAVVEDLLYLPYGDVLSGNELSRFTYTGQESDLESGFMDYGARQYNPQFGRFLQPDPVISDIYNPQNLNRYAYVLNNPYKYTDPDGKEPVSISIYALIESGLDVISITYNSIDYLRDPSSSVNKAALALDVADLLSGPFSNPLPSGISFKLSGKAAKEFKKDLIGDLVEDAILEGAGNVEDEFRGNEDDKIILNADGRSEIDKKIGREDEFYVNPIDINYQSMNPGNDGRGGRSIFADGSGSNPGPSGSGLGNNPSSSSGGGSSGSSNGGSGSGSGGHWWCFGIFC